MKKIFIMLMVAGAYCSPATAQKKLLKEAPGVVSFSYRADFAKDVAGTLDKIKAVGITNIEFSNLFGKTPAEMKALLDERGMRCTSIGVGQGDLEKNMDKVIAQAKTLGAEFVRIGSISHPGDFQDLRAEHVKKAAEDFNKYGKVLYDNGLTYCYHNHGPEFKGEGELGAGLFFDYLVANTDPKYVSFEMDVMWVYWPGQDPIKWLQKYPDRFRLMHVKNVKKGLERGGKTSFVSVGEGQMDMEAIIRAAKKTKIKYFYIEDESAPEFIDAQMPESVKFLNGLKK
ncbi:sugar phosphate isomerase/epimerase family protein [Mucilaginibacter myungsuensis]|uniref:Sugar phosphate isomerase/epimerase n=1 Tax=Mucilaginibacter myungsuensis TaxID=649104 RepID=A0A929KUE8_9SPHI|nr:sugar phosphate isomerase/epimerase [Mucilaginibacter myungsuensis]MBE9660625.1 sugar phosphate isomerase/epimerase [Mucilaginibacter myungsuensis]MDN3600670.1 sugar phosphate isomerase/epimerase [Mucilaginibacter myungsuensis]